MKKMYLIKNPVVFQGERYLNKNKDYFEGWYFKNSNGIDNIAFIPGISINNKNKVAFIQIITNDMSYYIDYNINDFEFNYNPFYIRIKDNYFSLDNIHIDINDIKQNIVINGDLGYYDSINIVTNNYSPNIMGPFSYIPFMECNHAIISMKNKINGSLKINDNEILFDDGMGYIEKDFGCSFPKFYVWCQGNNFKNKGASFMISIANIPFKIFNFNGLICSLIIDEKEYRFATYNNSKIIKFDVDKNSINILLKKGHYYLNIKSLYSDGLKLIAPINGGMNKEIFESITEVIDITLMVDDKIIFNDTSKNCGLEIVLK